MSERCGWAIPPLRGESFDKKTLKRKLGLRSDDFGVTFDENGANFETYGYGHGVGMSQTGSNLYAKQGWTYVQILNHYYPGTTVA